MKYFILALFFINAVILKSQIITAEDSLSAGLVRQNSTTIVSGYGEVHYQFNKNLGTAQADLRRNVLFLGHRFDNNITFFSEMELEHALVGENKGEIGMEQLFLKFNLNKDVYLTAGLFIPRIGLINENHLPTTYNGMERPYVEELLIPATWREIGIGVYGNSRKIAGLNYSLALMNGLNAQNFSHGDGIRGGRSEGSQASAKNIAITAALIYYINHFRFQVSGYTGGTSGISRYQADSLGIQTGAFSNPVFLGESNFIYTNKALTIKGLAAIINIPNANKINYAYANNTPELMAGGYFEIGYDLFFKKYFGDKKMIAYARFETLDLNKKIPVNGIMDKTLKQNYAVIGLSFLPIRSIVIKTDIRLKNTGEYNSELILNPFPQQRPYLKNNQIFTIGVGYSF